MLNFLSVVFYQISVLIPRIYEESVIIKSCLASKIVLGLVMDLISPGQMKSENIGRKTSANSI